MKIWNSKFFLRQFQPGYTGTALTGVDAEAFAKAVEEAVAGGQQLQPGYAPFCKHVFLPSRWPIAVQAVAITDGNRGLIRSDYEARSAAELPVLTRWIDRADLGDVPAATVIDVILYSAEQVRKENAAMPAGEQDAPGADYYIVAAKGQDVARELPMAPITAMRNALISEGGSGVAIDREAYNVSVAYWRDHVIIR